MAKIGIMIEGQEGLTWTRWERICRDVDSLGFDSLRRSEHFFSVFGATSRDCIECWSSLALAAEWTNRVDLGVMVSPITFRPPALLARTAAAVDLLSAGRLILGVGAGWYENEHVESNIAFPTLKERMDLLEQGIKTIRATWAKANPKPVRKSIPLVMGGPGEKRTMPIAAREADEFNQNLGLMSIDVYRHKREVFSGCCRAIGRDPATIRQSVLTGYIIGRNQHELRERAAQIGQVLLRPRDDADQLLEEMRQAWFIGTPDEISEKMRSWAASGIDLFMLQHWLLDDQDALKLLASDVIPAVA